MCCVCVCCKAEVLWHLCYLPTKPYLKNKTKTKHCWNYSNVCYAVLNLNPQQFARSARPKDNTDTKKGPKQRWTEPVSVTNKKTTELSLNNTKRLKKKKTFIIIMVFSFCICVYTLFIQDAMAWYCDPAEAFVSLFCLYPLKRRALSL